MPHDRFSNFLSMGRKLVADRRANEVSSVGIKALLHQQIDMAQVDVTEVDCDLFCFAGFVAKAMNFSGHGLIHLCGWYMDASRMVSRGAPGAHSPRKKHLRRAIEGGDFSRGARF